MEKYLLEVENLRTCYCTRAQERIYAVDDVSFQLAAGKIFGVAGESGCGKSTLALSLMGLYLHLGLAYYVSENIYIMERGRVAEAGNADEILLHPRGMYTRQLIAGVPKLNTPWFA